MISSVTFALQHFCDNYCMFEKIWPEKVFSTHLSHLSPRATFIPCVANQALISNNSSLNCFSILPFLCGLACPVTLFLTSEVQWDLRQIGQKPSDMTPRRGRWSISSGRRRETTWLLLFCLLIAKDLIRVYCPSSTIVEGIHFFFE